MNSGNVDPDRLAYDVNTMRIREETQPITQLSKLREIC